MLVARPMDAGAGKVDGARAGAAGHLLFQWITYSRSADAMAVPIATYARVGIDAVRHDAASDRMRRHGRRRRDRPRCKRRHAAGVGGNRGFAAGHAALSRREEMLAFQCRLHENAGLASAGTAFRVLALEDGLQVLPQRIAAGTMVSVVAVAQLVRVPDCDSGGRGFESPQPPH